MKDISTNAPDLSLRPGITYFESKNFRPFDYQLEAWRSYLQNNNGLLNAPTGSGKTLSLLMPVFLNEVNRPGNKRSGLRLVWVSPIRALTKEIFDVAQELITYFELPWEVAIRTGDTSSAKRAKMRKRLPEILITTPESIHVLLATKGYPAIFSQLEAVVADEWHELLGSKRAVLLELALSRLKALSPSLKIWGISATIGNLEEAAYVLLGNAHSGDHTLIRANVDKKIEVKTLFPDEIEKYPWSGHLGIKMLEKVLPIIRNSKTTLIFTNVRSQCEIWYQRLLEVAPELAGVLAIHHGSLDKELRSWVEEELHKEKLKAVVCTSSLDLGVDFRPVESIVQIGSPRGVARFMQRAGRSGHRPGEVSRIYFLPTHSLELIEVTALRDAIAQGKIEGRPPHYRSFDVLIQYLITLAVSEGFYPDEIYEEVKTTFSFDSLSEDEWQWVLSFIRHGGESLDAYDEFQKIELDDSGKWRVMKRSTAQRHRLSIGTIVSNNPLKVKFINGGFIGTLEEWFLLRMKPGDRFWFAGKALEFVRMDKVTVYVRKVTKLPKKAILPSWQGNKMNLSSQLAEAIRTKLTESVFGNTADQELHVLKPLLERQKADSVVPKEDELLIEKMSTREGHHIFVYLFEGRFIHEGISHLLAYRLNMLKPLSFSIAFTDYGFELLCDQEIPIEEAIDTNIFSTNQLSEDILASVNSTEMAKWKFRDIAHIAGLVFQGFPGEHRSGRHLQSSSGLFFDVFREYDPDNLLLHQSYQEVMEYQLEETRLRRALERIENQKVVITYPKKPTPFAFPIMTDRFRERFFGEQLEEKILKMKLQLE
jgi:ATP-dependent Lhr-like helicase